MNLQQLRTKAQDDHSAAGSTARAALAALDARDLDNATRLFVEAATLDLDYADGVVSVSAIRRGGNGGRAKTDKKRAAVRTNGKKGGRPKKEPKP